MNDIKLKQQQNQYLMEQQNKLNAEMAYAQSEIEAANAKIGDMQERLNKAESTEIAKLMIKQSEELKKMKDREFAIKYQIYHGKKDDIIDKTLEQYLNSYPEKEKLKILFLRQSEGVYQFGQKKVYMKIEKGNNLFVRIGGGFMHIDNFIQTYTSGEVDKIDFKDVTYKF